MAVYRAGAGETTSRRNEVMTYRELIEAIDYARPLKDEFDQLMLIEMVDRTREQWIRITDLHLLLDREVRSDDT